MQVASYSNYLQNKTSRLYHIRRTYTKGKNKNVLEVLKSSKYIWLFSLIFSLTSSEILLQKMWRNWKNTSKE